MAGAGDFLLAGGGLEVLFHDGTVLPPESVTVLPMGTSDAGAVTGVLFVHLPVEVERMRALAFGGRLTIINDLPPPAGGILSCTAQLVQQLDDQGVVVLFAVE